MFGVTRQRVCQWISEGKLPAIRRGQYYFVAAADCHRPPKGKTGPKGPRKRKARVQRRGHKKPPAGGDEKPSRPVVSRPVSFNRGLWKESRDAI